MRLNPHEQAIKITAKLYECRDTVRALYPVTWREQLQPFMAVLEGKPPRPSRDLEYSR